MNRGLVYTISFSFHIASGMAIRYGNSFCLHDTVFISSRIEVLFTRHRFAGNSNGFTVRFLHLLLILRSAPGELEARRIDNEVPYRVDTGFNSNFYMISDWFHATFIAFSFENAKTVLSVSVWCGLM